MMIMKRFFNIFYSTFTNRNLTSNEPLMMMNNYVNQYIHRLKTEIVGEFSMVNRLSDSSKLTDYATTCDSNVPRAINVLNFPDVNGKALCIMSSHRDPSIRKSGTASICIQAYNSQIRRVSLEHSLMAPSMPMYPQLCYGHAMIPSQGCFGYKLWRPRLKLFSRTITTDSKFKKGFIDYTCNDRILLVGDGDFSFGMCIAILIGDATNITVTSLDSYADLTKMYPMAQDNIDSLLALGGLVLHQVDATEMYEDPRFFLRKYDKIIYNMPHAGFLDGFGEHDEIMISRHRKLLTGYFKNASRMLNPNGEIHVRHHTEPPYDKWNIIELAKAEGLKLLEETPFNPRDYPRYSNKRGAGDNADNSFRVGQCSTYKFVLAEDCVSDKSMSILFFMNSDL